MVYSTGIKFVGDCERRARRNGVLCNRRWLKVYLAMDPVVADIRAVESTLRSCAISRPIGG